LQTFLSSILNLIGQYCRLYKNLKSSTPNNQYIPWHFARVSAIRLLKKWVRMAANDKHIIRVHSPKDVDL